jgi:predicted nucleic acid-binding protein
MADLVIVPDASVLLKWVLRSDDENGRDRAHDLKDAWLAGACEIVVPGLWVYEVGNVLGRKAPAAAAALLEAMMDLGMREVQPRTYVAGIFTLMRDHKITFYDAAYHALALHEGGLMLTADAAYVRKAGRAGHVRLLRDWSGPAA